MCGPKNVVSKKLLVQKKFAQGNDWTPKNLTYKMFGTKKYANRGRGEFAIQLKNGLITVGK